MKFVVEKHENLGMSLSTQQNGCRVTICVATSWTLRVS